ncbi:putative ATP-dependent RNA helicase DDX43 [Brevipalpus obovatus]|uniref:putative ATP-dependent RNA helicase DDX43 n=1 Tax=Brevipalpus obovatus TaxID=246614 RepID=UPI003D9F7767
MSNFRTRGNTRQNPYNRDSHKEQGSSSNTSNMDDGWSTGWDSNDGGWGASSAGDQQQQQSAPSMSSHDSQRRQYDQPRDRGSGPRYDNNRQDFFRGSSNKKTITVPSSDVGKVIGRGGSTIKDIQSRSGARVKVSNDNSGYDTSVDIIGTDEQVQIAENLINETVNRSGQSGGYQSNQNWGNRGSNNGREEEKLNIIWYDENNPPPKEEKMEYVDWDAAIAESEKFIAEKWSALPPIVRNFYKEHPEVTAMTEEEVEAFREQNNKITVSHFNENDARILPKPIVKFEHAFEDHPEILEEIKKQKFQTPSPIQSQAWPILLQGYDLIGIAQTGTGKTLAYLLPALIHIEHQTTPRAERVGPTALVLAPTRELAQQIEEEARKYSYRGIKSICVYGGGSRRDQINEYRAGAEIVIATPGRLHDLQMSQIINLTSVSYLVLDEADRMLDMGFEPQIMKILIDVRPDKQTVMMSATWPPGVRHLAKKHMTEPMQINVGSLNLSAVHSVDQEIRICDDAEKEEILYEFVKQMQPEDKVIIFASRKDTVDYLSVDMSLKSVNCQSIHGGREQCDRETAIKDLKTGETHILVATDVASRGLDIDDISHIFNYDFPTNIEEYVHRIGRTGRAGRRGKAVSLVTRGNWKHATELIKILEEANQSVPQELVKMGERYTEWKKKKDEEEASLGGRKFGRGGPRW